MSDVTPEFSPNHAERVPAMVVPGTRIGAYTVERFIGSGGASQVYLAKSGKGAHVAIKLIERNTGFTNEINAALRLKHEHIVEVHEVSLFDGRVALAMRHYRDGTLADQLRKNGPFGVGEAASALKDIALALAHAHSLGFVHGDLKPSNVLVDRSRVAVGDFGLARIEAHEVGVVGGTIPYEAPECLRGEPPTHESDAFALGAVAFELLTGTRAFPKTPGPRPAVDFALLEQKKVPEKFVALIRRLLADDPSARPSIREAQTLLAEIQHRAGAPLGLLLSVYGVVLLLVLGTFGVMVYTNDDREAQQPTARNVAKKAALARLPAGIPSAPAGVSISPRCTDEEELAQRRPFNRVSWTVDPDARWYMVFRNGDFLRRVADTTVEDFDVEVGKTYTYFMQACNEYGCGANSASLRVASTTLVCTARPPRCNGIRLSRTTGDVPLTITFAAAAISDTPAKPGIHWDFGDGQMLGGFTDATHTFVKPGTYTVRASVYDAVGRSEPSERCTATVTVGGEPLDPDRAAMLWREESASRPGSPYVDVTPRVGTFDTEFEFTAKAPAMYGRPVAYRWDFNDTGVTEWTPRSASPTIRHRFTHTSYPSPKFVRLQVTYEDGQTVDLGGGEVWILPRDVVREKKWMER